MPGFGGGGSGFRKNGSKVLDNPIFQKVGLNAYIPRYTVIKKGVIKDVPEVMEVENLTQQLNSDDQNNTPYLSRSLTQSDLRRESKGQAKKPRKKDGCGKSLGQYVCFDV
jgi:hypothetical protein